MKKFISIVALSLSFSSLTLNFSALAGATEVAFETDPGLPLVYLNVAVKAGAVVDPDHKEGLTNFVGEMLLRGTKYKTKEQIDLALDQMGARLDVDTRAESMILRGAVLSAKLPEFLALVRELITGASFPETEIKRLKSEVVSGILEELGQDPALGARSYTRFLFNGHPYGKSIIGKLKDVESFTRADLVAHYDRIYRDSLLLVVGTGDAKESDISTWANRLGQDRAGKTSIDLSKLAEPENPKSTRVQIIDKPDRTQTQINFGQVGIRPTDSLYFPLFLGNQAFGGPSFSARLMVEIRVKRGWSYGANSSFRMGLKPRSWSVHLFPAEKDSAAALETSLKMVHDLQANGITQAEFDFAKESEVNSAGFMYNTPKKRAENRLLERTIHLPDGFIKSYGPEISKVTLVDVNGALRHFLKPDQLSISVLGTAAHIKDGVAKAAGVPVDQIQVQPYTAE